MSDFLDQKRKEIDARLKELKPLVEEFSRLEQAKTALDGVAGNSNVESRTPQRSSSSGRRGRPRGSGSRGNEALVIVRKQPGITIPEIAEKMGIKQNYLYRVLPGLADDGLVRKEGRCWHPTS